MSAINLALGKMAYSSTCVLPYTASRAVDGSTTPIRRWLCNTLPGWMCVDLGWAYRIDSYTLRNMSVAGWRAPDYNLVNFKFQGSNSINSERDMKLDALWTDIDVVTGNTLGIVTRSFPVVTYRYIRFYVSKGLSCNNQLASVMELEVYKAPDSSLLTNLTLSAGTLTPVFSKNTFAYTAQVNAASITLTPTAEQVGAIIKVNGVQVASGQPSSAINLALGANTIPVQVIAQDGLSQTTYSVVVTRTGSPYLTNLTLSNIPFAFSKNVYTYNLSTGYDIVSTTITPTLEDSTASYGITVNGTELPSGQTTTNLNVGTNTISVQVTATTGAQQTYTLTVVRASSPYLSGLTLKIGKSSVSYTPAFNRNVTDYTTTALGGKTSISIIPSSEDTAASINVGGTVITSGGTATLNIPTGSSQIKIIVTASIGTDTKQYNLNINN